MKRFDYHEGESCRQLLERLSHFSCSCHKEHVFSSQILLGNGAIEQLSLALQQRNIKRIFLLADERTFRAAGERVCLTLNKNEIHHTQYVFREFPLEPNEASVGLAIMNFDPTCDAVVAIGSGVINDIGKIVAHTARKPYVIVATSPSMDGYASATSSMTMNGLKISLNSRCADIIVGDTEVLCNAPTDMMISGLGDMLAKYVSICEWRLSHVITNEYYCEAIAQLVRNALQKCVDNARGLLSRDPQAVNAVFEGLVLCGAAMQMAGVSRPASGTEHYLSHIWDMRGVQFGTPVAFHGTQCAVGTLATIRWYEKLKTIVPDKKRAVAYAKAFDKTKWHATLREFLGESAESMIQLDEKECKYDLKRHRARLDRIVESWNDLLQIINEELPDRLTLERLFETVGLPKTPDEIGIDSRELPITFKAAKDIRDKYVLPRLCWDLGILDEFE